MADENEDPREVPWHPRFAPDVVGHNVAYEQFQASFEQGKPHHAWLMTGPSGCGKATLAYSIARYILSQTGNSQQTQNWVSSRSHPDLAVLERSLNDAKPKRLKGEISVDDARRFMDFFGYTSSGGGWRVGIVDGTDDLNAESANALLKLIEEPPSKCLFLLICSTPGRLLRTVRSRCRRLPLAALREDETRTVLQRLPLDPLPDPQRLAVAAQLSGGRPGHALELLNSGGSTAFHAYIATGHRTPGRLTEIGNFFATRSAAAEDYRIFMALLLDWLARQAAVKAGTAGSLQLAALHAELSREAAVANGYNLDRRVAVIQALHKVEDALKAA